MIRVARLGPYRAVLNTKHLVLTLAKKDSDVAVVFGRGPRGWFLRIDGVKLVDDTARLYCIGWNWIRSAVEHYLINPVKRRIRAA